ncbi:carboxypeptidase-like regulatory domain-containing protein [Fulvivirga sediminis]|uniref:Carboxypeptidase-like regulatory domain-containing protein n=1 Tax=Fulvivirga sediminis TaxID=2803949 RepID=A0A937F8M7_9BACT|nr:carboxypeptidase-like regulatory domain-containing protein [Fulvivirga sediminis]MBL3656624.1 carboxypeptidase-like regulatory domain-containing protein [Fulvivirga sediminis]
MKRKAGLIFAILLISSAVMAQKTANSVRVVGMVLHADNRESLPYVSVQIKGTMYGTSTDNSGYFTVFINPGDTLNFSSIGYNQGVFIMPFELHSDHYSLVQLMRKETVLLNEVVVFPWPSVDSFEKAFLDTKPKKGMEDLVHEVKRDINKTVDENTKSDYYYDQMRYNRLYELTGQMPPNNFLNPMRWSNFFRDLKEDEISNKRTDEDE